MKTKIVLFILLCLGAFSARSQIYSITGAFLVCSGATTTLTGQVSGTPTAGTWTSTTTGVATVGASSGIVSGVAAGTITISYTPNGVNYAVQVVTVSGTPILSQVGVCHSYSIVPSNATNGGTWSSSNTAVGTIETTGSIDPLLNVTKATFTGLTSGTTTISYTNPDGCVSTWPLRVDPLPPSIIVGSLNSCIGGTGTLVHNFVPNTTAWSSSDPGIVSIGANSGVFSANAAGTATITYTAPGFVGSCYNTTVVTVSQMVAPITGTMTVCSSGTSTLSDATGGGTWSSSNNSIVTVGSTTGIISGVSTGTATITYRVTATGCYNTATATVAPNIGLISFSTSYVCEGHTINASNSATGGVWTSSNTSIATIGASTGIITGISAGTATITYTAFCGTDTKTVSVNTQPVAITGPSEVCVGSVTSFTDATAGGTWLNTNHAVGTIDATTGQFTAVAPGTCTVLYLLSGCAITTVVTVEAVPDAITGTFTVCEGATTALSNALPGGTWSSSNASVATVDAMGIVTGTGGGTATIMYLLGVCPATAIVTVDPLPDDITGTLTVCIGATSELANAIPGGTWSSSDDGVATVSSTGVVTGIDIGTATISYMLACGTVTAIVAVYPSPATITATLTACVGETRTMTIANTGGVWSSSDNEVAAVDGEGVVTGNSPGTAAISYTFPSSCYSVVIMTINALPEDITGTPEVCEGSTTMLDNGITPGTWSSSDAGVATVDGGGVVTGVDAGTAEISYTLSSGCGVSTVIVTVDALPASITDTLTVCVNATTTLADAVGPGEWTSSDPGIAAVDAGGVVTGVSAGTATISYMVATGCGTVTATVTVNPIPDAITGPDNLCAAGTITLADATAGGTWSSSDDAIATVNSSGEVTGMGSGTVYITYIIGTGCYVTKAITLPKITSTPAVCVLGTVTLSAVPSGGTWTSSNTGVATINMTTGEVYGATTGTTTIDYILSPTCFTSVTFTVGTPFSITAVCEEFPIVTCDDVITYCNNLQLKVSADHDAGNGTFHWTGMTATDSIKTDDYALLTFANPPAESGVQTVTATYNGCTATAQIDIEVNGSCSPCEFFKPCIPDCEGCDTVPYFKTIIASTLTTVNIPSGAHNYFINRNAELAVSPDAGNLFFMGTGIDHTGVKLTVESEVLLNKVHFFSAPDCPWKGIEVKNDDPHNLGELTVSGSLIENASIAGVFLHGTESAPIGNVPTGLIIHSDSTIYNRDFRGISIEYYMLDTYPYGPDYPVVVLGNVFTSRNFCGYHIDEEELTASHCYPYTWPSARYLRTLKTSDDPNNPNYNIDNFPGVNIAPPSAGISLVHTGYTDESGLNPVYYDITIGNASSGKTNLFDTLNCGVSVTNSNVSLELNIFRRLQNNGTGIYCYNFDDGKNFVNLFKGNTFYNNMWGVLGSNYYKFQSLGSIFRADNYFYDHTHKHISGLFGIQLYTNSYESYNIKSNKFSNVGGVDPLHDLSLGAAVQIDLGSSCDNGPVTVTQNEILGLVSDTSHENVAYGIQVYENNTDCSSETNNAAITINNNTIKGMITAIEVGAPSAHLSTSRVHISNNAIIIRDNNGPASPNPERNGISCFNLTHLRNIANNHIYGDTAYEYETTTPMVSYIEPEPNVDIFNYPRQVHGYTGIRLENVDNSGTDGTAQVSCNYIHDLNIGFEYYRTNSVYWRHNVMMRNAFGLVIAEDATMGSGFAPPCDPDDNVWDENQSLGITTGWPGWNDPSVHETFTVNVDAGSSPITVRHDPSGSDGSAPPYYFPLNNGTIWVEGVAYDAPGSILDANDYCSEELVDTFTCAPVIYDGGEEIEGRPALPTGSKPRNTIAEAGNSKAVSNTVDALTDIGDYAVLPNPSDGNIMITRQGGGTNMVNAAVMDMLGNIVYRDIINLSNSKALLRLNKVARGIYMLVLTDANGVKTQFKIVIER